MLTELKLSNFRIFDHEVTVRFRPITVLIGRNSSGKSSIIKFLLMLQQSSAPGQSRFLSPEGDKVSLGDFAALKNSLTRKRNLTFELSANTFGGRVGLPLANKYTYDFEGRDLRYKTSAKVLYSRKTNQGSAIYSLTDESSGTDLLKFGTRALEDSSFWDYPPMPHEFDSLTQSENNDEIHDNDSRLELLTQTLVKHSIIDTLSYQINSIRHLLPVRAESQRVIIASILPLTTWDNEGNMPYLISSN